MSFMPLYGYEATRDLESLDMHVLFPAAFIVSQFLKFQFTESCINDVAEENSLFLPPKYFFSIFPPTFLHLYIYIVFTLSPPPSPPPPPPPPPPVHNTEYRPRVKLIYSYF